MLLKRVRGSAEMEYQRHGKKEESDKKSLPDKTQRRGKKGS